MRKDADLSSTHASSRLEPPFRRKEGSCVGRHRRRFVVTSSPKHLSRSAPREIPRYA